MIIEHLWQKSVWKKDILQFNNKITSVSNNISELKKENLTRNLIIINHPRQHFLRCEVFKTKRFSYWLLSTTYTPISDNNINQPVYLSGSNYSYMMLWLRWFTTVWMKHFASHSSSSEKNAIKILIMWYLFGSVPHTPGNLLHYSASLLQSEYHT